MLVQSLAPEQLDKDQRRKQSGGRRACACACACAARRGASIGIGIGISVGAVSVGAVSVGASVDQLFGVPAQTVPVRVGDVVPRILLEEAPQLFGRPLSYRPIVQGLRATVGQRLLAEGLVVVEDLRLAGLVEGAGAGQEPGDGEALSANISIMTLGARIRQFPHSRRLADLVWAHRFPLGNAGAAGGGGNRSGGGRLVLCVDLPLSVRCGAPRPGDGESCCGQGGGDLGGRFSWSATAYLWLLQACL